MLEEKISANSRLSFQSSRELTLATRCETHYATIVTPAKAVACQDGDLKKTCGLQTMQCVGCDINGTWREREGGNEKVNPC